MSLTIFFIVLSIGIGYMLYDTFKKSRQNTVRPIQSVNNRLKVNYTKDCTILNKLQKQKKESIKTRTISISLNFSLHQHNQITSQQSIKSQPTKQQLEIIRQMITLLKQTHRIYLLLRKDGKYGALEKLMKQLIEEDYWICCESNQGAVAVLRQLSSGIHLQANPILFNKIKQYLNNIWYVGQDPDQQAIRQFNSQVQMLIFLNNLNKMQEIGK